MDNRAEEYKLYLESDRWKKELSPARLAYDEYECVLCGNKAEVVHHRRYPDVFGMETIKDLVSLCHRCHHNYHFPPSIDVVREDVGKKSLEAKGCRCPCCKQYVKRYKRSINYTMARSLLWLVRTAIRSVGPDQGWINFAERAPRDLVRSNQLSTLKYWGLVEKRKEKKMVVYRATPLGVDFANERVSVQKYGIIYNDVVEGFDGDTITMRDALSSGGFDYDALMKCEIASI